MPADSTRTAYTRKQPRCCRLLCLLLCNRAAECSWIFSPVLAVAACYSQDWKQQHSARPVPGTLANLAADHSTHSTYMRPSFLRAHVFPPVLPAACLVLVAATVEMIEMASSAAPPLQMLNRFNAPRWLFRTVACLILGGQVVSRICKGATSSSSSRCREMQMQAQMQQAQQQQQQEAGRCQYVTKAYALQQLACG